MWLLEGFNPHVTNISFLPLRYLSAVTQWWNIWSTWQQPKSSGRGRWQTSRPEWRWTRPWLQAVNKQVGRYILCNAHTQSIGMFFIHDLARLDSVWINAECYRATFFKFPFSCDVALPDYWQTATNKTAILNLSSLKLTAKMMNYKRLVYDVVWYGMA